MRDSSRVHRALSALHCSRCCSACACTSVFQAATTLAADCLAMWSTLVLSSFLVVDSSPTQSFSARKALLKSDKFSMESQSCRNLSKDWFNRVSSFTCCWTCAVTLRSVLRHSSKRVAKWDKSARSTTACIARTQSIASAWKARRHMSALELRPCRSPPPAARALKAVVEPKVEPKDPARPHGGDCNADMAPEPSRRASSPSLPTASCKYRCVGGL
mmetsp:Transcript_15012/g.41553  ORF Transcript_15012/g.41553 Transcript_15012/m.41553 type:complete len:216 (+) Transcript_15012:1137-1784(+)